MQKNQVVMCNTCGENEAEYTRILSYCEKCFSKVIKEESNKCDCDCNKCNNDRPTISIYSDDINGLIDFMNQLEVLDCFSHISINITGDIN